MVQVEKVLLAAILLCFSSASFIPKDDSNKADESTVEETHHATCSISSDDVAATANATITRQLRGICTSAHLDNRLDIIEKILIRELNDIKDLLFPRDFNMIRSNDVHYEDNKIYDDPKRHFSEDSYPKRLLKSKKEEMIDLEVLEEIREKNMSIVKDDVGITFSYFWKIDNIIDVMASKEIVQSGDFHFAGYHLYLRLIPQLFSKKNIFVQVVGIGEFNLAHQFSILSQTNVEHDIFSPIFINCAAKENEVNVECEAFEIPKDLLIEKKLIKNDLLILKLMIYL